MSGLDDRRTPAPVAAPAEDPVAAPTQGLTSSSLRHHQENDQLCKSQGILPAGILREVVDAGVNPDLLSLSGDAEKMVRDFYERVVILIDDKWCTDTWIFVPLSSSFPPASFLDLPSRICAFSRCRSLLE